MATNTPSLGLALLGIGESAGTWGIPLNNNFSKIDILAGEIVSARGSEADLNSRFSTLEVEMGTARGVLPTLNDRLSVLLASDGYVNINNFPFATQTGLGVTRLSVAPDVVNQPISVGDNDPRLLTQSQLIELTGGGVTSLHVHTLDAHISDVTSTADEINQALSGIEASVTAGNLNMLTNGSIVPKSMMTVPVANYAYDGLVRLSATPADINEPIAVGDNDTRVLAQAEKDGLVTGNITALHKHNLAEGATDVTLPATVLNQLTGMGTDVTASNLDILVGGGETILHAHTNLHYTKSEADIANTANNAYADAAVDSHDTDDTAHDGGNLNLGNITASTIDQSEAGVANTIRSHTSDIDSQVKFEVKDRSGISKAYITTNGEIVADKITTRIHEVIETTTLSQDAVATSNLQVDGNTVLGDNNAVDVLTANVSVATFNGDVVISAGNGLTVGGTINGKDLDTMDASIATAAAELLAARQGEANLTAKLVDIESGSDAVAAEVQGARGGQADLDSRLDNIEIAAASLTANQSNPHTVTITQAIAADVGTGITTAELETLSDGSDADLLHTHAGIDSIIADTLTSSVYGIKASLGIRLDDADAVLNGHTVEITNARGGEASVDARLDNIDGDILTNVGDIGALNTEIVAARGGESNIDARLDNMTAATAAVVAEVIAGRDGESDLITKVNSLESYADAIIAEVTTARNGAGSLDIRLDGMASDTVSNTSEIISARGGQASIDARLDGIDGLISSNNTTVSNNITGVVNEVNAARGGQANLDTRLDTMSSNAAATAAELIAARDGEANLLAKINLLETTADAVTTEVINARGGEITVDARIDTLDALVAANAIVASTSSGNVTTEVTNARDGQANLNTRLDLMDATSDTINTEIVNARGGQVDLDTRLDLGEASTASVIGEVATARGAELSLDARLDAIDLSVLGLPVKYVEPFASSNTFSVVHNLGTKAAIVQLRNTVTDVMLEDADITSITMTDNNTVDIVIGSATAVEVVVIG